MTSVYFPIFNPELYQPGANFIRAQMLQSSRIWRAPFANTFHYDLRGCGGNGWKTVASIVSPVTTTGNVITSGIDIITNATQGKYDGLQGGELISAPTEITGKYAQLINRVIRIGTTPALPLVGGDFNGPITFATSSFNAYTYNPVSSAPAYFNSLYLWGIGNDYLYIQGTSGITKALLDSIQIGETINLGTLPEIWEITGDVNPLYASVIEFDGDTSSYIVINNGGGYAGWGGANNGAQVKFVNDYSRVEVFGGKSYLIQKLGRPTHTLGLSAINLGTPIVTKVQNNAAYTTTVLEKGFRLSSPSTFTPTPQTVSITFDPPGGDIAGVGGGGPGCSSGTIFLAKNDVIRVTIGSNQATDRDTVLEKFNIDQQIATLSCTLTTGSNIASTASVVGFVAGQLVSGTGIQADTYIGFVDPGLNTFRLVSDDGSARPATASGAQTLTFFGAWVEVARAGAGEHGTALAPQGTGIALGGQGTSGDGAPGSATHGGGSASPAGSAANQNGAGFPIGFGGLSLRGANGGDPPEPFGAGSNPGATPKFGSNGMAILWAAVEKLHDL